MIRTFLLAACLMVAAVTGARAQSCPTPNLLQNNTIADATAVMSNFNTLMGCINNLMSNTASGYFVEQNSPPASLSTWLDSNNVSGKNPYGYLAKFGQLVVPTTFGEMALVGASRTSQTTLPNVCCSIGVAAININDNTTTPQGSWLYYGTASRLAGAGSLVSETDMFNAGALVKQGSYLGNPNGQVTDLALQCGGEPTVAPYNLVGNHCSAGLEIRGNGDTFDKGIVIGQLSISSSPAIAMELPAGNIIEWTYDATEVAGAYITSFVSAAANAVVQEFLNTGVVWLNANSGILAAVSNGNTGSNTSGVAYPVLGSTGNDALIAPGTGNGATAANLALGGLGTGAVNITTAIRLQTNTIATLGTTCTAGKLGQMYYVTDAAASPAYNAIVTGGGTAVIPVFCDGANWRNH